MNKTAGFILIAVGIITLVWNTFTYTKRENVVDAGPLHISADKQHTVSWPPVVGGIILIAGIVIVLTAKKTA